MTQFAQELAAHTGRLNGQSGADRETPLHPSAKPQPETSTDTFATWRSIRFREPLLLIFVPLAALALYLLALNIPAITARVPSTVVHASAIAIVGGWGILLIADYLRFRNWRTKLPFAITGWDDVVKNTAFETGMWRHAEIRLILSNDSQPEERKHFASGLIVFAHLANTSYGERFEHDPRRYWNTDLFTASGSINVSVAAHIIGLCNKKLKRAALRYPGKLLRVEIIVSGMPFIANVTES